MGRKGVWYSQMFQSSTFQLLPVCCPVAGLLHRALARMCTATILDEFDNVGEQATQLDIFPGVPLKFLEGELDLIYN